VAASAVLVVGAAVALIAGALVTREEQHVSYQVRGALNGMTVDVADADVTIRRGGERTTLGVERVDRFAFGHDPGARRSVTAGVLQLRSRCPRTVLHRCSIAYVLTVPDNIPLDVRTTSGSIVFRGYRGSARVVSRSGDVDVGDYCGNSLQVRAVSGDVEATASCAPPELELRTTTGSVLARVPAGRYQVDAQTAVGQPLVRGIGVVPEAPYAIRALSSSGSVVVERAP
jgi:hypothetical protein